MHQIIKDANNRMDKTLEALRAELAKVRTGKATTALLDGVKVEVKGDSITITGVDREKIGQTVANIERATRVKNRDVRVFQDGVYRTSKGGR